MFKRLKSFFKLPAARKGIFIESWFLLGLMRVSILTRPFKNLVRKLELHSGVAEQAPLESEKLDKAQDIAWAVSKASRFTPWQSACLVQVLAAQRMLQKRGIPGAFYLGATTRSKEDDAAMSAHAWLKCGGEFITGEVGHERFTVVSTFSWT